MDINREGFCYLKKKFPELFEAEIKEEVSQGPQIRQLILDCDIEKSLTDLERQTWLSEKAVINNFSRNTKSRNYKHLLHTMLQKFQEIKVNMSLKIHILLFHLDFLPDNLGTFSGEHGGRFDQDIAEIEKRYQVKWSVNALADYCWSLMTDEPNAYHCLACKRKSF